MNILRRYNIIQKANVAKDKIFDAPAKICKYKEKIYREAGQAALDAIDYPEYEKKLIDYYCKNPIELAIFDVVIKMSFINVNKTNLNEVGKNDNIYLGWYGYEDYEFEFDYDSNYSIFDNQSDSFYEIIQKMYDCKCDNTSLYDVISIDIPIVFGETNKFIGVTHYETESNYDSYIFIEEYYISFQYLELLKKVIDILKRNQYKLIKAIQDEYNENLETYADY